MQKLGRRVWALLVIVAVAPALFGQDEKIDVGLLAALSGENASAPFFVLFTDRADLSAASRIPDRAARGKAVVAALQAAADAGQAAVRALLRRDNVAFTSYWVENAIYVPAGDLALARTLASRPEVARIAREPVFRIGNSTTSANTLASTDWNIQKIRADQAWSTSTGAGMVVATIDSGVRYTHSALVNQYRGKAGSNFSHLGNWSDPTGYCGSAPCDNTGHGTMVMGVIVGSDGGANQIGVAPAAKWMACKGCANNTACYGSHLLACGQWILDPLGDGSASNQPDVVNNSWSSTGGDAWFLDMVRAWRAAGILPVFAAGNAGPACGTAGSPGDYPESSSIGATDGNDVIGSFSARGPSLFGVTKPNLTAPGVNVRSADYHADTLYNYGSGTSLAAPHVAGTVALIWSVSPALRNDLAGTQQLLGDTAVHLTTSETCGGTAYQIPNNTYGYGRVDALAAVLAAPKPAGPVAADDSYTVAEDGNLSAAAPGVLANDTGSSLSAVLVSGPANGALVLNSNGSFTYTPKANFNGADQFTYKAFSAGVGSNIATVRITVTAVNDAPTANNDSAGTKVNTSVTINVVANDTDIDGTVVASSVQVTSQPAKGGTVVNNGNGTVTFTPKRSFRGTDSFKYTVKDNAGAVSNVATVQVAVTK